MTYIGSTNSLEVTDGVWAVIANCTNTYTYQWQGLKYDAINNEWTTIDSQTNNSIDWNVVSGDPRCFVFVRAQVTATNEFGSTTEVSNQTDACS